MGQSDFRCDLAVRARGQPRYSLGVMVDTETYYENDDVLERDLLRPRLLRAFGWAVVPVLTQEWLANPDGVM